MAPFCAATTHEILGIYVRAEAESNLIPTPSPVAVNLICHVPSVRVGVGGYSELRMKFGCKDWRVWKVWVQCLAARHSKVLTSVFIHLTCFRTVTIGPMDQVPDCRVRPAAMALEPRGISICLPAAVPSFESLSAKTLENNDEQNAKTRPPKKEKSKGLKDKPTFNTCEVFFPLSYSRPSDSSLWPKQVWGPKENESYGPYLRTFYRYGAKHGQYQRNQFSGAATHISTYR